MTVAKREYRALPEGYDPSSDQGHKAVELFLDYADPPTEIQLDYIDGKLVAVATWDQP